MRRRSNRQKGVAYVEMLLIAPTLIAFGLGIVQAGLGWHGKTIVDYAVFEAARAGAVHHGLEAPMRAELGRRLAPLYSRLNAGDQTLQAIEAGQQAARDPVRTRLHRVAPSAAAFSDWGVADPAAPTLAIPNHHLAHRDPQQVGPVSGLSLHDANVLTLEVTHAFRLRVPLVGPLLAQLMSLVDPERREFYDTGHLPFSRRVSVRMQSDAWEWPQESPGHEPNRPQADDPAAPPSSPPSSPMPLPPGGGSGPGGPSRPPEWPADERPGAQPGTPPADPSIDPCGDGPLPGNIPVLLAAPPPWPDGCADEARPPPVASDDTGIDGQDPGGQDCV